MLSFLRLVSSWIVSRQRLFVGALGGYLWNFKGFQPPEWLLLASVILLMVCWHPHRKDYWYVKKTSEYIVRLLEACPACRCNKLGLRVEKDLVSTQVPVCEICTLGSGERRLFLTFSPLPCSLLVLLSHFFHHLFPLHLSLFSSCCPTSSSLLVLKVEHYGNCVGHFLVYHPKIW